MSLKLGEPMLPSFKVPEGYDTESYFRHVAREGLERRFAELDVAGQAVGPRRVPQAARDGARRHLEDEVPGLLPHRLGLHPLRQGERHPGGPGARLGRGSIVAYSMRITDLDPIPYNLLFERFLNPERVSMPDFDIDFCMDRRDEVIAYVQQKYGETSVGQIATFAELKSKSVVKDVARCIGHHAGRGAADREPHPAQDAGRDVHDRRVRSRSSRSSRRSTTRDAAHQGAARPGAEARGPDAPRRQARGRASSSAKGRSGTTCRSSSDDKSGALVTQYYKDDVEQAGPRQVRLPRPQDADGPRHRRAPRQRAPRLRARRQDARPVARIPLDDARDLQAPRARARRRASSSSSRAACSSSSRTCGPTASRTSSPPSRSTARARSAAGWSRTSSTASTGAQPIASMHPLVDELLAPTYGVIVYQEQVMQIAQTLAGYTLGGADLFAARWARRSPRRWPSRRAPSSRARRSKGVDAGGRRAHLRPARVLRRLRLQQEPLRGVRAHHVPDRVAEGALPRRAPLRDPDERQGSHREGRAHDRRRARDGRDGAPARRQRERHRLQGRLHAPGWRQEAPAKHEGPAGHVRPADPLRPRGRARVRRRGARGGVRGAAAAAPSAISSTSRRASTPSASTRPSSRRSCSAARSTRRSRSVGCRARAAFASVDIALERSRAASRDRDAGQTTLFGLFDAAPQQVSSAPTAGDYVECEPWDRRELLVRERQALGFYVSGHPLERYLKGAAGLAQAGAPPPSRSARGWTTGRRSSSPGWSRAIASASSRTAEARSRSSSSRT